MLIPCPSCGTRLKVAAAQAGRKVKCPACAAGLTVPAALTAPSAAAGASSGGALGILVFGSVGGAAFLLLVAGLVVCLAWDSFTGAGEPVPTTAAASPAVAAPTPPRHKEVGEPTISPPDDLPVAPDVGPPALPGEPVTPPSRVIPDALPEPPAPDPIRDPVRRPGLVPTPGSEAPREPSVTPPLPTPGSEAPREPSVTPLLPTPGDTNPSKQKAIPPRPKVPPKVFPPQEPASKDLDPKGGRTTGGVVAFMNTQAKGKRICIIADCSSSMRGGPIANVKAEIVKTLGQLKPDHQFYIIFFNAKAHPLPVPTWLDAGRAELTQAANWLQGVPAAGSTQPMPAFEVAFGLNPRPDVIFFLTDGLMPGNVPARVADLNNGQPRTVIHTLMSFRVPTAAPPRPGMPAQPARMTPALQQRLEAAGAQLRKIAADSGGIYRVVGSP